MATAASTPPAGDQSAALSALKKDLVALSLGGAQAPPPPVVEESPGRSGTSTKSSESSKSTSSSVSRGDPAMKLQQHRSFSYLGDKKRKDGGEVQQMFSSLDPEKKGTLQVSEIEKRLLQAGLSLEVREVKETLEALRKEGEVLPYQTFLKTIGEGSNNRILRALRGELAVPQWKPFMETVQKLYEETLPDRSGHNATYIPVLKNADPEKFGVTVCTVDGQMWSYGDTSLYASLQSCVKALVYALTLEDQGPEAVHRWVGCEPSGLRFNEISLNRDDKPHNPYVNAGAIALSSLFQRELAPPARFRVLLERLSQLAGGQPVGFCNSTYLAEYETAWRNAAICKFMESRGAFPADTDVNDVLDFYIQSCAVEVTPKTLAVIAATFANRGTCPLTKVECLSPPTVKHVLNMMMSCGMYDYSGEWCVNVGLPAKSGVSGYILLVVPNVLGMAVFSPRLDKYGNSVRAVTFCRKVIETFQYSIFGQLSRVRRVRALAENEDAAVQRGEHVVAFQRVDTDKKGQITVQQAEAALAKEGIDANTRAVQTLLARLTRSKARAGTASNSSGSAAAHGNGVSSASNGKPAVAEPVPVAAKDAPISVDDVFRDGEDNVLAKLMLGKLALPHYADLVTSVKAIFDEVKTVDSGRVFHELVELSHVDQDQFGVAVCSVDGQVALFGNAQSRFPITGCVLPALYGLALSVLGEENLHKFINREPTAADPHGLGLNEGKPYNPYTDCGALVMAARLFDLLGKDAGTRFSTLTDRLCAMAGDAKLGFSQPVYLEQKLVSHMLKAVANIAKGAGLFPDEVLPDRVHDLLIQLFSVEITCEQLALMAATFANGGVCPTTERRCVPAEHMKTFLSVTYACGMQQFGGQWNFDVNLPAVYGMAGGLMVVVPNVMGLAIYSPRLNRLGICSRGVAFCKQISQKYRMSIFDQLVYGDDDFVIPQRKTGKSAREIQQLCYQLLSASAAGDLAEVQRLVHEGADVNTGDYDKRTALHLACSEGHQDVALHLLKLGAEVHAKDRWGNTPMQDCHSHGFHELAKLLESGKF